MATIGLFYKPYMKTRICLALTEKTLQEDLKVFNRYKDKVDILELRVDHLSEGEIYNVHSFPSHVDVPVILTIRRKKDGGNFEGDEIARTMLFSLALDFTNDDTKRFKFIDLESDFFSPRLQLTCRKEGVGIIRSLHSITEPIRDFELALREVEKNAYDIIKIVSYSFSLCDTMKLFHMASKIKDQNFVLVSMGNYGLTSRILADFIGSCFVYTFSEDYIKEKDLSKELIDPYTLCSTYNFSKIDTNTHIFGIVGKDVNSSLSPSLHNANFKKNNINSVYVPISAEDVDEAWEFIKNIGIKAISVTSPFKEKIITYVDEVDEIGNLINSINTIYFCEKKTVGYNTDVYGFERALLDFLNGEFPLKVSVLGAGGASKAVCYVLKKLNFKDVVIFNRTLEKSKSLASLYDFDFASLDASSLEVLKTHSALIINATSVGFLSTANVLPFYEFSGSEYVFDLIYNPEKTALLRGAEKRGCKICNGKSMLRYQGEEQFKIFMGDKNDKR